MRKIFLNFLLAGLVLVTACGTDNKYQYTNSNHSDKKYSENQIQFAQTYSPWQIAESDTHYYHINGNFLYSISKNDGEVRALDNNPDTLDDKETDPSRQAESNAFFNAPRTVQYNEGKLYVLALKRNREIAQNTEFDDIYQDCLYEVMPDGSGQREIYISQDKLYSAFVHDGFFYFSTSDIWDAMDKLRSGELSQVELSELNYKVERVTLNKPQSEPELIYKGQGAGYVESMKVIGGRLHFSDYTVNREEKDHDIKINTNIVKKICNLDTFNVEDAIQTGNKDSAKEQTSSTIIPVEDGYMYIYSEIDKRFTELSLEDQDKALKEKSSILPDRHIVRTDVDGNEVEKIKLGDNIHDAGILNGYGEYLCLDNITWYLTKLVDERVLQILNTKGELLDEVIPPERAGMIVGMNADYIFLEVKKKNNSSYDVYRLNLNNLGKDNLEFEPFFVR